MHARHMRFQFKKIARKDHVAHRLKIGEDVHDDGCRHHMASALAFDVNIKLEQAATVMHAQGSS